MARISKSLIENNFKWFVQALGGRIATSYNDAGAYRLDYNGTYGGYNIEKISNAGGGISQPFGSARMKAEPFLDAIILATRAIEIAKGN